MDLGTPQTASFVKDVSEADFMAEVVETSMHTPVIVDFWAPWCGPCKTLGPALEAAVNAQGGKVVMAKVDVDQNQGLAAQLRVQSIPTVYAFYQGGPVDGFQGAVAPSEIEAFVKRTAELNQEGGGLEDAIAAAQEMADAGAHEDAAQTFAAILEEDPNLLAAYEGLAGCHIQLGQIDEAEAVINGMPADLSASPEIDAIVAQIALAREAENAGPLADLVKAVEADPKDLQARLDLAIAQHAAGQVEAAVDTLLTAFEIDRDWNDGAIKTQLFKVFDSLKASDPIVLNGRRRLSSMIFA